VSPICLGTRHLGGDWAAFDRRAAKVTIRRALDIG
jgi:hypothetical protein